MSNPDYNAQINSHTLIFRDDDVFDSVFAYILHLYSIRVSPFKRRVIESIFLLSAVLSLFILMKSHHYLTHVSSDFFRSTPRSSLQDEILRIEVTSLKNFDNYNLEKSYFKEFMHVGVSADHYLPLRFFHNITKNQCPLDENLNFYLNFTKSAKTESDLESTVIEYSAEYSLLRLSPRLREMFGIPVHLVLIDADSLLTDPADPLKFFFSGLIGMDILILQSLSQYSDGFSGYARNVFNGLAYSFSNNKQFGFELLALSILTYSVFTVSIFFLLNFAYNQIYFMIVNLIQRLEFNRTISAIGGSLTVILSFIGIELIISDFFQNAIVSCYVILLLWVKTQFDGFIGHSPTARAVFFLMSGISELLFYMHHYRYSGLLDRQALFTCWLFVTHSAFYCFHHYALPEFGRGIRTRNQSGE